MTIVKLAASHAADAARLHIAGQPGTFLTSLGPEVLTVLYRALPVSPVGFGYATARDEVSGKPPLAGFVSATTSMGRLLLEMGTRHLGVLLPPLCARFVRQPALLWRSGQTMLYPFLTQTPATTDAVTTAELLSIMVAPDARSQGIGAQLLQALLVECNQRGIGRLDVTVDATNAGARRFYERHGFGLAHKFMLYGRAMCGYQLALQPSRVQGMPHGS